MAAEYVSHDEFEFSNDRLIAFVQTPIKSMVRVSERRLRTEIQDSEGRLRAELQAFRERHDVELAQIHTKLGRIHEMLLYIIQRLPAQPIQPPPAQFLSHEK